VSDQLNTASHLEVPASVIPGLWRPHTECKKSLFLFCDGTCKIYYPACNHPENGGAAVATRSEHAAAGKLIENRKLKEKRLRHLGLGIIFYLLPIPLSLICNKLWPLPQYLILAAQSWLTGSATVLFFVVGYYYVGESWIYFDKSDTQNKPVSIPENPDR
jgi:hypothetical protein